MSPSAEEDEMNCIYELVCTDAALNTKRLQVPGGWLYITESIGAQGTDIAQSFVADASIDDPTANKKPPAE